MSKIDDIIIDELRKISEGGDANLPQFGERLKEFNPDENDIYAESIEDATE